MDNKMGKQPEARNYDYQNGCRPAESLREFYFSPTHQFDTLEAAADAIIPAIDERLERFNPTCGNVTLDAEELAHTALAARQIVQYVNGNQSALPRDYKDGYHTLLRGFRELSAPLSPKKRGVILGLYDILCLEPFSNGGGEGLRKAFTGMKGELKLAIAAQNQFGANSVLIPNEWPTPIAQLFDGDLIIRAPNGGIFLIEAKTRAYFDRQMLGQFTNQEIRTRLLNRVPKEIKAGIVYQWTDLVKRTEYLQSHYRVRAIPLFALLNITNELPHFGNIFRQTISRD